MKCQYCGSKLGDSDVCPVCGKKSNTPAPEPKETLNKTRVVLSVVAAVALVAVIVCMLGFSLGWFTSASENTADTDVTLESSGDASTSVTAKQSYATTTATPGDADMTCAVATFEGGSLTNSELNVYFWMEYYNFMSSYSYYASLMGLDSETPLDQQDSLAQADENDENSAALTWEQYFLEAATENYTFYKGLELAAIADNYTLADDLQSELDTLPETLQETAEENGYDDVDEFLQSSFGTGVTLADYTSYLTTYLTAYGYYSDVLQAQCDPTDDEVEAYFDENAEYYLENYNLEKSAFTNVQVRHILIQPEWDIDSDEDGTMDSGSDEAWAAAEAQANEIYALWQEDPTEDNFAALAVEYSADGNASEGGLYDDVYPGQMVDTYNDWCFDTARQVGDTGIVKTQYGYHIMYFSAFNTNYTWMDTAKSDLMSEMLSDLSESVAAKYTVTFDFSKVVICDVVTANTTTVEE
jgi:hypothetical protein